MRVPAAIFIIAGVAYGLWSLPPAIASAVAVRILLVSLISLTLLWQGYSLLRDRKTAVMGGLISAIALSFCATTMAGFLFFSAGSMGFRDFIEVSHPVLGILIAVALSFAIAAVLIWRHGKRKRADGQQVTFPCQ